MTNNAPPIWRIGRRSWPSVPGSGAHRRWTRAAGRALSQGRRFLSNVLETRLVGTGLWILGIVLFCALFADIIAPYAPDEQDYLAITEAPSSAHWLGTDDLGRDVLTRIIYGSRVSLMVGVIAVGIALRFGVSLGLLAGYAGGTSTT